MGYFHGDNIQILHIFSFWNIWWFHFLCNYSSSSWASGNFLILSYETQFLVLGSRLITNLIRFISFSNLAIVFLLKWKGSSTWSSVTFGEVKLFLWEKSDSQERFDYVTFLVKLHDREWNILMDGNQIPIFLSFLSAASLFFFWFFNFNFGFVMFYRR